MVSAHAAAAVCDVQCTRPITGYQSAPGAPLTFKDTGGQPVEIRCGQCIACRVTKSKQWATRCVHEASLHQENSFITLTYDPEHLPENASLDFKDWQDFMHRLRKRCIRHHGKRVRFFAAGEYGTDKTQLHAIGRPHFHAIIFGHAFAEDRILKEDKGNDNKTYISEELDTLWGKGLTEIGLVTFKTAAYVAQYTIKKINGARAEDHYRRVNPITGETVAIEPEGSRQSRRPGIGKGWYDSYSTDLHKGYVTIDGKRQSIPRYYEKYMTLDAPEVLEQIKEDRKKGLKRVTREALDAHDAINIQRTKEMNR